MGAAVLKGRSCAVAERKQEQKKIKGVQESPNESYHALSSIPRMRAEVDVVDRKETVGRSWEIPFLNRSAAVESEVIIQAPESRNSLTRTHSDKIAWRFWYSNITPRSVPLRTDLGPHLPSPISSLGRLECEYRDPK